MIDFTCQGPSKKVVLVGNPNCGKTTLFNALTGSHQRVGNWSGVTVEQKTGLIKGLNHQMMLVDLPGTYGLMPSMATTGLDEKITADYLKTGEYDVVLNIVDAVNLERNLYLTLQLLERGLPVVVAINRIDMLNQRGCDVDCVMLAERLGCPVIPIVASQKRGLNKVIKAIECAVPPSKVNVNYPSSVEAFIDSLSVDRSVALGYLEGEAWPKEHDRTYLMNEIHEQTGFDVDVVLAQSRYEWLEHALDKVIVQAPGMLGQPSKADQIDKLFLSRWFGIPIFMLVMYALFFFAINVGGAFQDFFDQTSNLLFVDMLGNACQALGFSSFVTNIIACGFGKGVNTVVTFIPVLGAMFFALSFLEDSGYMARAAFVMDRLMRWLGLPGKSFVSLIVGFGCNVPAIMGTRTLEQRRDRILTVMISPFMTCGARLAIFTLFVAAFFENKGPIILFTLYFLGALVAVATGVLLKKTVLKGEPEPLILELPPYQWPGMSNMVKHAWMRLKRFIVNAGKLIIPVCVLIGTLNATTVDFKYAGESDSPSILSVVGKTITPVFTPMGIEQDNWPASVGLVTGIMAKEVVIGTLNSLYAQDAMDSFVAPSEMGEALTEAFMTIPEKLGGLASALVNPFSYSAPIDEIEDVHDTLYGELQSKFHGEIGAFAYLIFVLLYFPCVSATAAMVKEVDRKWTMFSVLWTTLIAYSCAVLFFQLGTFQNHPLQSISWLLIIMTAIGAVIVTLAQHKPQKQLPTPIMVSHR